MGVQFSQMVHGYRFLCRSLFQRKIESRAEYMNGREEVLKKIKNMTRKAFIRARRTTAVDVHHDEPETLTPEQRERRRALRAFLAQGAQDAQDTPGAQEN